MHFTEDATLKELRRCSARKAVATPSELRSSEGDLYSQGFKANPGLELANAFSVRSCSDWKVLRTLYQRIIVSLLPPR
jgi:hypothetical protein